MTARAALDQYDAVSMRAAWSASNALLDRSNSFSYVTRSVRYTLLAFVPNTDKTKKNEGIRVALQAATDIFENVSRQGRGTNKSPGYLPVYNLAQEDIDTLKRGAILPPPLATSYFEVAHWKKLENLLLSFDPTWQVWIIWLRYRLFGLTTEDIPFETWPVIERSLILKDDEFWSQPPEALNTQIAKEIISVVDRAIEEEAKRSQSEFGLTFYVADGQKVDLLPRRIENVEDVKMSVAKEVVSYGQSLLDLCDTNTTSHIKLRVESYLDVLNDGLWTDDMLLVMRGDALRKELDFQSNYDEDSDIPPLNKSALLALEQTIRMHNMLVNAHPSLSSADRMLLSPDTKIDLSDVNGLRALVETAENREILTTSAKLELEEAAKNLISAGTPDRSTLRSSISILNFSRSIVVYAWKNKGKIAAIGSLYGFGKWLIANESVLTGLFKPNSVMHLLISRLMQWLHTLPLA